MSKKKLIAIIASAVAVVLVASITLTAVFCGKGNTKDTITLMCEELSGLYNPFYATSGADQDVIGMTQIGMLSTDSEGKTVAGDDYATVVKDYKVEEKADETVYTFVIKNGLKFSDGKPLTMNDVLFNMYEYLDPVYTGSSTMYSIDIKGLTEYRTQQNLSSGGEEAETTLSLTADAYAVNRLLELQNVYMDNGLIQGSQNSYSLDETAMKNAIDNWSVSIGYKQAVANESKWDSIDFNAKLKEDYEFALETFKKELQSDFNAAKESFDLTKEPYKEHSAKLESDVFKFLLYEGKITPVYAKIEGTSRDDKNKILRFENEVAAKNGDREKTEQEAINLIYNDNVKTEFINILTQWGTSGTLRTQFTADAKDVLLHANLEEGELPIPNISGIVSLGHTGSDRQVIINGTTYNVAREHSAEGVPTVANTYDVLQITVNGVDPKAIYNFGFTVAPVHYYSDQQVDIVNNKFGVKWGDSDFQSKTIQSQRNQEIPMGAGPYKASDINNSDNPNGEDFVSSKVVYFKANNNFMFPVKTEKVRFQVVSSTNAIDKLANGEVDYITPQFTIDNSERLEGLKSKGIESMFSWQLGYGYIGINAGKVTDIDIRRAIMSAMQTSLALEYYKKGTVYNIDWPMSMESWAYPWENKESRTSKQNGHDYTQWINRDDAVAKVKKYMNAAGVSEGDSSLKITFTIAGSSISEHPCYPVFLQAKEILDSCGFDIEVKADSYALTKLATGSLSVWAAAWGSTIDPDMYQVYHKNSSATSVYAWGYREIKADTTTYSEENRIINALSNIIDDARETTDQDTRTTLYEKAMWYVLELAVEMPVYQRQNLYAYNSSTVKGFQTNVNPYTSPLEKVWELELVK